MKQKIIKAGPHSLAVVIPAPFIHSLGIKKGDSVEVDTNTQNSTVKLKFKGSLKQLSLPQSKGDRKAGRMQKS